MTRRGRSALFVTKFSDSDRTAIGVQTARLMSPFRDRVHAYWIEVRLRRPARNRTRLESLVVGRGGPLRRPPLQPLVERVGLSWWREDRLRRTGALRRLARRVDRAYIAPIDRSDATRMRFLMERLRVPYVLHLWDSLTVRVEEDADMRWLAEHAARVLVLSQPLVQDLRGIGVDADELLFTRAPATASTAGPPAPGSPVRIALLGVLDPYADGVVQLDAAVRSLAARGVALELTYIGAERALQRINPRLSAPIPATGFLPAAERDARLAACHLGFLPGPSADPELDLRSRYSIPSRTLDFLAVGLPTVGTVHAASATGRFLQRLGLGEGNLCGDACELAAAVERAVDPTAWLVLRDRTLAAWAELASDPPEQRLLREMDRLQRA